jgi:hypothetical protein
MGRSIISTEAKLAAVEFLLPISMAAAHCMELRVRGAVCCDSWSISEISPLKRLIIRGRVEKWRLTEKAKGLDRPSEMSPC